MAVNVEAHGIPMLIMQTWKTTDIPQDWKAGAESIQRLNPMWRYVLMTDEDNRNFIAENFPNYLSRYDGFAYNIERADFIRYAWLYVHGGIYIDLDYEMLKSFDDVLAMAPAGGDVYLVQGTVYQSANAFMISKPRCDFWLYIMDSIQRDEVSWYHRIEKHLYIIHSTGPGVLLKSVSSYAGDNKIMHLPLEAFPVCSACEKNFSTSTGRKLEGTSWVDSSGMVYLFMFCNFNTIVIITIVLLLLLILILYMRYMR